MTDQPFPHLFMPMQLGSRQARNRIMRLATTSNLGERHQVSERLIAHLVSVARGGAGIWVGAQRTNDGLRDELTAAGANDVHLIGDAFAPAAWPTRSAKATSRDGQSDAPPVRRVQERDLLASTSHSREMDH